MQVAVACELVRITLGWWGCLSESVFDDNVLVCGLGKKQG